MVAVAASAALSAQTPTFSSIQRISTGAIGNETSSLAFYGNFNGNGNTDLIVGLETSSSFKFLTGNGTGKFSITGSVSPIPPGNAFLVTDVNGDGKDDIISLLAGCQEKPCNNYPNDEGDADGIFTAMLSQGSGKFTQGYVGTLPPGLGVVEGVVADFNKDGKPDIAVLAYSSGVYYSAPAMLCIFLNQGMGIFTQTDYQTPASLGYESPDVTNMVVGDFEGNGNQDIAFAFDSANGAPVAYPELLTFAGNGKGGFGPGVVSYTFDSQFIDQPNLFAADLNGDGRSDLLIGVDTSSSGAPSGARKPMRVASLLANTSGRFYWSSAVSLDLTSGYPKIDLSDLNGDGKPDLLFLDPLYAGSQTAQGGFYLGLGTGSFKTPHIPTTFTGTGSIIPIALKKGALPSLFVSYGLPYIQLRINTTKR
ncbi:MAG: VCBS repeat-containing protein [Acidobacteriaceae bacterium]